MGNGVGWANVLSTVNMVATYQGKIIAHTSMSEQLMAVSRTQDQVDEIISSNKTWSEVLEGGQGGPLLSYLSNEDGTDVTDYVNLSDVPGDALSSIVFEPKFYLK